MDIKDIHEKVLRSFLEDWLEWANSENTESPQGVRYCKTDGLCGSLRMYVPKHGYVNDTLYWECSRKLNKEFEKDGLDCRYPFGEVAYITAHNKETQHKDPKRLAWVLGKLNEANSKTNRLGM